MKCGSENDVKDILQLEFFSPVKLGSFENVERKDLIFSLIKLNLLAVNN